MQYMTREEIKALLRVVNPKHRLMFKVGFWHGLRVSEFINLTGKNIRDGYVTVQRLKGSLHTCQPYQYHPDPDLDESVELTALALTLKDTDKLFPFANHRDSPRKIMQRAYTKAGIPLHKLHPHVLKHSIAMQTIQSAGIENVRQWLGHKNISSTGAYLKVSDETASLAIGRAMSSI